MVDIWLSFDRYGEICKPCVVKDKVKTLGVMNKVARMDVRNMVK